MTVSGEVRFRQLPLQGLIINSDTHVLDLCCGSGQATQFLVKYSQNVTLTDETFTKAKTASNSTDLHQDSKWTVRDYGYGCMVFLLA